jgi:aryl-alcohol dehydrogenase-like predicted oxidoreductase
MDKIRFGNTKIEVSRLCFGTEPFTIPKGPKGQKIGGDLSPQEGGLILKNALGLGVNFWDTSNDYGTHPHVAEGLRLVQRHEVVIADKSYAKTSEEAEADLQKSLAELGTDYIDIMLLHYVPLHAKRDHNTLSTEYVERGTIEQRFEALKTFCEAKESGIIRAVGLSTHSTKVLNHASRMPEIEVVCATLNEVGTWIEDGSLKEHISAIKKVYETGKAVYVIKVLDAGKLRRKSHSSLRFAFQYHQFIDAFNIGMYSVDEVRTNLKLLKNTLSK